MLLFAYANMQIGRPWSGRQVARSGKVWGTEQKDTRSLGTWDRITERQPEVVVGVGQAEGLGLDGGWGRVGLASQKLLSSVRCLPGLRLASPSKVGSGSPGTICCWRGRGRAGAQLGWGRGGPGTPPPPPLRYRRLRCNGGREAHKKTAEPGLVFCSLCP
jgi:hypothetical protein